MVNNFGTEKSAKSYQTFGFLLMSVLGENPSWEKARSSQRSMN